MLNRCSKRWRPSPITEVADITRDLERPFPITEVADIARDLERLAQRLDDCADALQDSPGTIHPRTYDVSFNALRPLLERTNGAITYLLHVLYAGAESQ